MFPEIAKAALARSYAKIYRCPKSPPSPLKASKLLSSELEKVVKELEAGDLPLERSLELFEKGMALSETCRKQLENAETRVEMLIRKEGKIQPEPFRPDKA